MTRASRAGPPPRGGLIQSAARSRSVCAANGRGDACETAQEGVSGGTPLGGGLDVEGVFWRMNRFGFPACLSFHQKNAAAPGE